MFDCLPAAASDIRQDKETTRDLQVDSFWWKPRRLQHWELGTGNGGKKDGQNFFHFFFPQSFFWLNLSNIFFLIRMKNIIHCEIAIKKVTHFFVS